MSMRGHKNAEQEQQQQDQDQAEVEDTYEYCACKRKTAESGESGGVGSGGQRMSAVDCIWLFYDSMTLTA